MATLLLPATPSPLPKPYFTTAPTSPLVTAAPTSGYGFPSPSIPLQFGPPTALLAWRSTGCSGRRRRSSMSVRASAGSDVEEGPAVDCIGTGNEVECFYVEGGSEAAKQLIGRKEKGGNAVEAVERSLAWKAWEWALLVSPFFFWGTSMVAMKEVIPKTGPFFVAAVRLIPAGALLVGFAAFKGRKQPIGFMAWFSILLFAVIDATCFQGFLAEGLQKTSAGLGSVIIDSQPLTVAILAALLFGESIGVLGIAGLGLGVIGLLLLEIPAFIHEESSSSVWGSGEWWMFLAAQSMAIGTVMVRWVSKYSDPIMATGYHMILGGLPLVIISLLSHDSVMTGGLTELTSSDYMALLYTSVCGSALSYGVFFYNATKGSLTKLSSLTFLTPMFASVFGYFYLGETFTPFQLCGALVTLVGIYMVNYKGSVDEE